MLDFEGVHSVERSSGYHAAYFARLLNRYIGQEDLLLVLFNSALSNLILVSLDFQNLRHGSFLPVPQ